MAAVFDALGFAKHLREAGVSDNQSEAQAEAARDFLMPQIVTKSDIQGLEASVNAHVARLEHLMERQTLTLTVRTGGLLVVAVGTLAALIRLA